MESNEYIFSRLRFLDMLHQNKGKEFSIFAMTIHRPGFDNCFLILLKKEVKFEHNCVLLIQFQNCKIKILNFNYLYECNISVNKI